MRTKLAIRLHASLEKHFPERRLFLKSDSETRYIRLRPATQILAISGCAAVLGWTIIATAILLMDTIGSGGYRQQALRDQQDYQATLDSLAAERDSRQDEALAAQKRFNTALAQVSRMQTALLESEARQRELETGIDVIQGTLHRTIGERDDAREKLAAATAPAAPGERAKVPGYAQDTLAYLTQTLKQTATERDGLRSQAQQADARAGQLSDRLALMQDRNDVIFHQLEDALDVSVEPLRQMFRKAGLDPDDLIDEVKRGYSGMGGPLQPISFSTMNGQITPDAARANEILKEIGRVNLYRIAATKTPFDIPVHATFRYSSPFGVRRDPFNGRIVEHHYGQDMAAPTGTPIYSTADGVVTYAGWMRGYGKIVKIKHSWGFETRYGHMSRISVHVGQNISRGEQIGAIGATGRATGPHLHYEIRVNGKPVNPLTYIKAAQDVF